jgi:hypothetical protein
MPANTLHVSPTALLQAAASVAEAAGRVASPHPDTVPVATPGSPADAAWAGVGAGMVSESAEMTTEATAVGPQIQAATQSGVAQLQGQDEQNADAIGAVGDSAGQGLSAAAGAPGGVPAGGVQSVVSVV